MRKLIKVAAMLVCAGALLVASETGTAFAQSMPYSYVQTDSDEGEVGVAATPSDDYAGIAEVSGLGVAKHTKAEIIQRISDSGAKLTDEVTYKTMYSITAPYSAGVLSDETLNSAIAMLNNVRYIAGLNYDVTLDAGYTEACQAGAMVNLVNGPLSHYPTQPEGMSDTLYNLGYKGCSEANIAVGFSNLNMCIIDGWLNDGDPSNISRVGHRAWCLNPTMGKTGFGAADGYYNMYAFDSSNSLSVSNIAWPAQVMPLEYFSTEMPWSVFTGSSESESTVKVTLTRQSDGKEWCFSQESADGDFYVTDYIQDGTIIFRPNDITGYADGDVFTVSITGIANPLSYTVTFFTLGEALGHTHTFENGLITVHDIDIDAMTADMSLKCDNCDTEYRSTGTITSIETSGVTCGFSGYIQFNYQVKLAGATWSGMNYKKVTSLPHKYGDPTFVWDGAECNAQLTCSRCSESCTKECTVTSKSTATCTSAGTITYTATWGNYSDTKTESAPMTAHQFLIYSYNGDGKCGVDGTETATCMNCDATDTRVAKGTALSHSFGSAVYNEDATCMADGTRTWSCLWCNYSITETAPGTKLAHKYENYISNNDASCVNLETKTALCIYGCKTTDTITVEGTYKDHKFEVYDYNGDATCMADGTKTAFCEYGCGETHTVTAEGTKLAHKYENYISNNNATCIDLETKTAKCIYGCGSTDTITVEGSNKEHRFEVYDYNGDATCMADGTKTAFCEYGCGETHTVTAPGTKLAHKYENYISNNDATCIDLETKTAKCIYGCGSTDTITVEGSNKEHKFEVYNYNDDATCMADGTKTAFCEYGCGETHTVTVPGTKLAHKYENYISNNDATCIDLETKTAKCIYGCGSTDTITVEGSNKEHKFEVYNYNGDATCMADGTKTAFCEYGCGEIDTITAAGTKTPHKFTIYENNGDATCTKHGTKTARCDYGCGEIDTVEDEEYILPHTPSGEWVIVTAASASAPGEMYESCTACGQRINLRSVAKLAKISLSYTSCVYDGTAKRPDIKVYDGDGKEVSTDYYTIVYGNNTAAGVATAKVTFSGNYTGTFTKSFVIKPKATTIKAFANTVGGVKLAWNKASSGTGYYLYRSVNGGAYKKIKDVNSLATTSYVDTGAKSSGAKYAYKVVVYKSSGTKTYTSSASPAKATYFVGATPWKGLSNVATAGMTVKYTKVAGVTGYQIQYSRNSSMTGYKLVKVAGGSTVAKTIQPLSKNIKYYVRVRSYKTVNGKTYYSAWNSIKSLTIKQ